jgi:hypothetical protein
MTDLHKEEYQTLRKEVETAMSELNSLESGALITVAGIFAWLFTHKVEGVIVLGWFIPFALVFFCILRAWTINRHLGWLGEYLKRYETALIKPPLSGWEHFLSESPEGSTKSRRGLRGSVTYFFWGFLLIATLAGAVVGCATQPQAQEISKSAKQG